MKNSKLAILVLVALGLIAGACGSGDKAAEAPNGSDAAAPAAVEIPDGAELLGGQGETVTVTVKDNVFEPAVIVIKPGTTVKWVNEGRNPHNVAPVVENQFKAVATEDFGPGAEYEVTFNEKGQVVYYCTIHGTYDKKKGVTKGQGGAVIVADSLEEAAAGATGAEASVGEGSESAAGNVINVPGDYKSTQEAVDAANPGDLILIEEGTYKEAVVITTDNLVIRGVDRNKVVFDGEFELENAFKVVGANGVAIENMTAQNYTRNGFFWTGATGYRGSYLTTTKTGDYGIYAFDSTKGQFDHDYASGSPDAGYYIGQCDPCDALVYQVTAEYNGLGWSGTNASRNLIIAESVFRFNRAGIVPNSGDGEALPPEEEQTIVGNLVYDNNNGFTPAIDAAKLATGNGILVAGGNKNIIEKNRVINHLIAGIGIVPNPDKTFWISNGNIVKNNVVSDAGEADLAFFGGEGNCFADNEFVSSKPSQIQEVAPCEGTGIEATDGLDLNRYINEEKPPTVDYKVAKTPAPPELEGMKDPRKAPARPATDVPMKIDLDSIKVPDTPADSERILEFKG